LGWKGGLGEFACVVLGNAPGHGAHKAQNSQAYGAKDAEEGKNCGIHALTLGGIRRARAGGAGEGRLRRGQHEKKDEVFHSQGSFSVSL
jgi:hypothetical protein